MAGLVPRVSGTVCAYHAAFSMTTGTRTFRRRCAALVAYGPKSNWGLLWLGCRWGFEKFRDRPPMHQIGTDEPREGERTCDDFVGLMGEAQQQESDQCDRDLNAHGVFGGSEEVSDLQGLLDPACPGRPRLFYSKPARQDVDARDNPPIKSGDGHDAYFFTRSKAKHDT